MTSSTHSEFPDIDEALFSVQGLWCTSCALAVEAQLTRLPGVMSASLHYPSATLLVCGQPETLDEDVLASAVRRIGYRLGPPEAAGDAEARLEQESRYLILRLLIAASFGMWTMLASLLIYAGALPDAGRELVLAWVSGAFALPVVTYAGLPFYRAAWRTVRARRPGMDALVSLGTLGAVAVSLWLLYRGSPEVYFDTAVMLILLLLAGRLVETLCRHRGLRALQALHMPPGDVRRQQRGRWRNCPVKAVAHGDCLRVDEGEVLPLDGVLCEGEALLDLSPLTGESAPRRCLPGDAVAAGCRNLGGSLVLEVTALVGECRLDKLREQMWWQQARKGELQRLADRFAAWLSPLAVGLALFTWGMAILAGVPGQEALVRALSVLVVACPCAVGLAVPLAGLAGSGQALAQGVVFRDPSIFESLAGIRAAAFDKTGTLTPGEPRVLGVSMAPDVTEATLLSLSAEAVQGSQHPLARALRRHLHDEGVAGAEAKGNSLAEEFVGRGRRTRLADGRELLLGSRGWLAEQDIAAPQAGEASSSEILLACDGRWLGGFTLGETPLPGTGKTLASLREAGLALALISGDRRGAVESLARTVGLAPEECYPERSPEAKARLVRALPQPSLYVGDGINDVLGLATATVGVAPLGASSAAREGAGVVLMRPGIEGVASAWRLARRTRRVMRQNLVLSGLYNALALGLAVSMAIPPLVAVLAMVASSLSVMGNAARLAWQDDATQEARPVGSLELSRSEGGENTMKANRAS
ncbi:cation-transporting P-type ATPase [Halomonas sp. DQ26W]|uniref:heavy metal translocating P-type ATPase n=1 Tax=Halomonas sp. DQ26W TaxID=2282311 RepID=UPI000DF7D801|nr:cation-translocating P-type ATPase [Halomonas sp. DQ26W]RDB43994.1 cation-transporting P-type ATPase [Halomonas sp. DQ26W]